MVIPCCWVLMIVEISSFELMLESSSRMKSLWRCLAHAGGVLVTLAGPKAVPSLLASSAAALGMPLLELMLVFSVSTQT